MKTRSAFTLVELVVVIMILGILAGVAAPKLLDTSATATENGIRTTLSVVRDAIEMYAARNSGDLPIAVGGTQADFKTALSLYIRGEFPECPVAATPNANIAIVNDATPTVGGAEGWKFSTNSGAFICNVAGYETF